MRSRTSRRERQRERIKEAKKALAAQPQREHVSAMCNHYGSQPVPAVTVEDWLRMRAQRERELS